MFEYIWVAGSWVIWRGERGFNETLIAIDKGDERDSLIDH